jgi:hypothetical protein
MEDIFATKRGVYQVDTDTGIFTVRDQMSTPKRFLGSVDPSVEVLTPHGGRKVLDSLPMRDRAEILLSHYLQGPAIGFTPKFRKGYRPLGITCHIEDIESVGEGSVLFSEAFRDRFYSPQPGIKVELASKIEHVYRQLRSEERMYRTTEIFFV